jgi:L-serine/L-threonine ammonia-lyase
MSSDTAQAARSLNLFRETPLILSQPLTALVGKDVYLKLDSLQDSGSFKDRGMAHLCHSLQQEGTSKLISSSGGNAGLAVATVGKQLGMEVDVIVPETTKQIVIEKLQSLGAKVKVYGENWNAADQLARKMVAEDETAAYISPYDNPLLWTGHSTLIDEIESEIGEPGCIIASVGGGGLICGVLEGLERKGMWSTTVIAAETIGASSFGQAWQKGEPVRLSGINSIATSLGALEVTPVSLERAKKHIESGGVVKESMCTDAEAVDACLRFAQDHRLLVEPACGAALAVAYSERLRQEILDDVNGPIVIEVCGGSGVNVELLTQWKKDLGT